MKAAVNNVAIEQHEGRIFLGVRTSKSHFASNETQLIIASAELTDGLAKGVRNFVLLKISIKFMRMTLIKFFGHPKKTSNGSTS